MTSQPRYLPILPATTSASALDPVIDCIINSGITLEPEEDQEPDEEPDLDDDGEPVLSEDDIQAMYADWCRDGRGFGI